MTWITGGYMISEYQLYFGDKFRHFVGQVPLNRAFPVQPHFPFWEGPNAVYCCAPRRCLQLGKVIRVRYPDRVGRYKPCVPELFARFCPCLGPFMFCHDGGRWCLWLTRGHPGLRPVGSESEWPGECHGNGGVLLE